MRLKFDEGSYVTFDLDPDKEILRVVKSGYFRTDVVTMDGIDISHATDLLSPAEIPAAQV